MTAAPRPRVTVLRGDQTHPPHLPRTTPTVVAEDECMPAPLDGAMPIGVFPYPAGLLLIPGDEYAGLRAGLLAGHLPAAWPPELAGIAAAYAGAYDSAVPLLAARAEMTGAPEDLVNLLAVAPEQVDAAALAAVPPRWSTYARLVQALTGTDAPLPPDDPQAPVEVRALVAAGHAADAAQRGDRDAALVAIDAAIGFAEQTGVALQALMLGARAQFGGGKDGAKADLRVALNLLDGTDVRIGCAELHLALADLLTADWHAGSDGPEAAIGHLQSVLQTVESGEAPFLWASAHAELATIYLTMPMTSASDQLRVGVAMQSLRKARSVFDPDETPRPWASVTVNLANALVYSPSTHQAENIGEAVDLYGQVLDLRDRAEDPSAYAVVLANQGNALAHLGRFDEARIRLHDARSIFDDVGDVAKVAAVRSVLDEIARTETRTDATGVDG